MRLVPLDIPNVKGEGRVTVIQREIGDRTKGGLIVPDLYRENNRPSEADVIEVSSKVRQLKPGDHVVYNQHTGCEVKLGKTRYVVMRESDVLAKFVPEESDNAVEEAGIGGTDVPAVREDGNG